MEIVQISPLWPPLSGPAGLHQAARNGYFACLLICLFTTFLWLLGGTALGAFVDIFFYFLAGLGVRSFSRLAAGSAMVMLIAEKSASLAAGNLGVADGLGLLMLPLLFHATHAGFAARTLGITPEAPLALAPSGFLERLENLPALLWPQVWIAFRFYLVGLITMMLAGFAVRQAGLLQ